MTPTFTLLSVIRCNGKRQPAKMKPQPGLTMKQLKDISAREIKKLYDKHPEMDAKAKKANLDVLLNYIAEQL